MIALKKLLIRGLSICVISALIFLFNFIKVSAEEIDWIEVANTTNKIQYIDVNSIKYNKRGQLSVVTKYSELNPEDHQIFNTNYFLIAVDCENRLFSELPLDGELKQVKNWIKPTNDKLIKKTIMSSCTY